MNSLYTRIVLIALLFFTVADVQGVDNRPRRKKNKIQDFRTEEEKFIDEHFAVTNFSEWKPGRRFVFVGGDFSFLFRRRDAVSVGLEKGDPYIGKIFTYETVIKELGVDGLSRILIVFDCEGEKFVYETQKTEEEVAKPGYEPLIPNLTPIDNIEKANRLLQGKTFYIMTPVWYNEYGERVTGRKLVPVTIDSVEAGDYLFPYRIIFRDDSLQRYSIRIVLKSRASSGDNLTFDRVFSFQNPRLKYEEINDTHWASITQGRVMPGMTKQACKLAWGSPAEIERFPYYDGLREQWMYRAGSFLYFENGLLVQYRY